MADSPAFDRGCRDVRDLFDLGGDGVVRQIVEGSFVQFVTRDRHDGDGDVGYVKFDDKGLQNAWWETIQNLSNALHHLHLPHVDIGSPVEPDLHSPEALLAE